MNELYYGDCLQVLLSMKLNGVDLIYLDPPFNSDRTYNAIYKDNTGKPLPTQIEAFCDTWTLDEEQERTIRTIPALLRERGVDVETAEFWRMWMISLRKAQPRLLAYLAYMVPRLLEMQKVLKPQGSIYLHCDSSASHYLKVMMDGIFGHQNFRNEIIWQRTSTRSDSKEFDDNTDTILYYSNGDRWTFNRLFSEYEEQFRAHFRNIDPDGRMWRSDNLTEQSSTDDSYDYTYKGVTNDWSMPIETMQLLDDQGRLHFTHAGAIRRKQYLDEQQGQPVQQLWTDISPVTSQAAEQTGYSTQKPVALLERIIEASSNAGDVVLDPFCGCATTLAAAQNLGRKWIGVDIAIHSVNRVAKNRLEDTLGLIADQDFTIEGIPNSIESAQDLWERDKHHFEQWAVEEADGFVTNHHSADGGIDGRIYYASSPAATSLDSMLVEVKGSKNVGINVVRKLRGVLERKEAQMIGLVILNELGDTKARNFRSRMAQAGDVSIGGTDYPRMQLLTVRQVLDGQRFNTPGEVASGPAQPIQT